MLISDHEADLVKTGRGFQRNVRKPETRINFQPTRWQQTAAGGEKKQKTIGIHRKKTLGPGYSTLCATWHCTTWLLGLHITIGASQGWQLHILSQSGHLELYTTSMCLSHWLLGPRSKPRSVLVYGRSSPFTAAREKYKRKDERK